MEGTNQAAPGAGPERVPLGHGIQLQCAMPARDGAVEIGLTHGEDHLDGAVFHHDAPRRVFRIDTALLDIELEISVDHFSGEVTASGGLALREHELISFEQKVLASFSPCSGTVGQMSIPDPPVVKDGRFGASRPYASHVTRIFVDERPRLLTPVGALVKKRRFPQSPPFVFNTVSCIGGAAATGPSGYPDPRSPWFNVFVGYYQIDAPKRDWTRPFGYVAAEGPRSKVESGDLLALGKADWNWFANWMYGVPEEHVEEHSKPDPDSQLRQSDAEKIGESRWHTVSVGNLKFVSAYESDVSGAERLRHNSLLTTVWRRAYGEPCPCSGYEESFVPTRMNTRIHMSYWEDDEAFHTTMFGGSARSETDRAFLDCQMAAARRLIERTYPTLGFPLDPGRPTGFGNPD